MKKLTYFIGDLHFSHKAMIANRGFKSITEHDELIINNWNNIITNDDEVYIVGNITMDKPKIAVEKLSLLNGEKYLIAGNHDKIKVINQLVENRLIKDVLGSLKYKGFIVTHIPVHTSQLNRYIGNIHAHTHQHNLKFGYFNVSVDNTNYKPLSFKQITNLH